MSFRAKKPKDPSARRPIRFDFRPWLNAEGVTVSTYVVTVTNVTKVSDSHSDGVITVVVEGGTVGTASVAVEITTTLAAGQALKDKRTVDFAIEEL